MISLSGGIILYSLQNQWTAWISQDQGSEGILLCSNKRTDGITDGQEEIWDFADQEDEWD
jgi:hypothetical protein